VPGLLVAVLLISSLLLVHFSLRAQPMPEEHPLDVDEGLPLPEAGQASTVFSLTALFGAYFGIALLLGLPALTGLAFGTALGLFLIRYWIDKHGPKQFEAFLLGILSGNSGNAAVYALVISGVQCAYAASELLILREIAKVSLGMRPDQATLLAIGVAIIGYFYVLFGGYVAVFRTDVLQFVLVSAMAIIFGAFLFSRTPVSGWTGRLLPRPGYWEIHLLGSGVPLYFYHFIIGTVMGVGLLAASPDAWKRVFLVSRKKSRPSLRFLTLVSVGIMPYLVLLPFAMIIGPIPDGEVNTGLVFSSLLTGNVLFVAAALGLIASFLSSFDSALLASVHVGLILKRKRTPAKSETSRFHWLMVTALLTIYLLFSGLTAFGNPYLLGNLLLGAYAVTAGVQIGSRGSVSRLPENSLLWIYVVGLVGWFLYFTHKLGLPTVPTTYQVNTVPGGVILFFITAFACQIVSIGGRKNVRR
jgi:Na+/proline symporter